MIKQTFSVEQLNKMVARCFAAEDAILRGDIRVKMKALHELAWVTDTLNALVPNEHQKFAR